MSHGSGGGGGHGHCGHGGHQAHIAHNPDQSSLWNQAAQSGKRNLLSLPAQTLTPIVMALVIFTVMLLPFVLDWPTVENAISKHQEEENKKAANYAPQFAPVSPSETASARARGLGIDPFSMPGAAPRSQEQYAPRQFAQPQYAQPQYTPQQYTQSQYPQALNPYAQAGQGAYCGQPYGGQPYAQNYGIQPYGAQSYGNQAYFGQGYGGQDAGQSYGQAPGRFNRFDGGNAGLTHMQRFKVVVER